MKKVLMHVQLKPDTLSKVICFVFFVVVVVLTGTHLIQFRRLRVMVIASP